jgi:hypothetical protein
VAKLRLGRIQTSATAFKPTLAWAKIADASVVSQWVVGSETGTESRWCTLRSVHHLVARGAFRAS